MNTSRKYFTFFSLWLFCALQFLHCCNGRRFRFGHFPSFNVNPSNSLNNIKLPSLDNWYQNHGGQQLAHNAQLTLDMVDKLRREQQPAYNPFHYPMNNELMKSWPTNHRIKASKTSWQDSKNRKHRPTTLSTVLNSDNAGTATESYNTTRRSFSLKTYEHGDYNRKAIHNATQVNRQTATNIMRMRGFEVVQLSNQVAEGDTSEPGKGSSIGVSSLLLLGTLIAWIGSLI